MLAAACAPSPLYSPTPTIQGDHDRVNTAVYRIYAQRPGDTAWPWVYDIPYHAADAESEEAAPVILQPWPIQRVVPTEVQNEEVRVMIKAVSAANVESAPSNIVTVCMSPIWAGGPYE